MRQKKKYFRMLLEMTFAILAVFMLNSVSSAAATFTYKGTEYDTENAVDSYTPSGEDYELYKFKLKDGTSMVYICGETEDFFFRTEIHEAFPEIKSAVFYFDNTAKGFMRSLSANKFTLDATEIVFGEKFNSSQVTDLSYLFDAGCSKIKSLDLTNLDTSNVTNLSAMFGDCSGLKSLDVSPLKTSKVTNMNYLFFGCSGLTSLDVSKLDTGNVTSMMSMFYGCSGLTDIDISAFKTSKVTTMSAMFKNCSNLKSIEFGSINTAKVTSIGEMFSGCKKLTSLDMSKLSITKLDPSFGMYSTFYACSELKELNLSNQKLDGNYCLLDYCKNLKTLKLKNATLNKDLTLPKTMYDQSTGKEYKSLAAGKYNIVLVDDMNSGKSIKVGDKVVSGTNVYVAKKDAKGTLGLSYLQNKNASAKSISIPATVKAQDGKTYKVFEISASAFKGNKNLATISIGKNVTTIGKSAFINCTALKTVKGASAVTSIGDNAFSGCKVLKTVPALSKLKTIGNKVFYNCAALTKFTIGSSVSKIGKSAFQNCKKLKTLTIKTTKLTDNNVGASAFKSISATATVKVPKNCLKDYQKLLKKKGINGKKQKIKK